MEAMTPTSSCLFPMFVVRVTVHHVPRPGWPGCVAPVPVHTWVKSPSSPHRPAEGHCLLISTLPEVKRALVLLDSPPSRPSLSSLFAPLRIQGRGAQFYPAWRAAGHRTRYRLSGRHVPSPHARCTRTGARAWTVSPITTHQSRLLPEPAIRLVSSQRWKKAQRRTGKLSQPQMATN